MTIYQKNCLYGFHNLIELNKLFTLSKTIAQGNKAPTIELK